ncbi:acetylornithine aminotransferase apoenzyme [Desulfatibacillum alkenivorans DSM 16219]|jgi:acetylornithine aminotransferase|uniref:Acetylornithine aminotransferase n=1 Tax=Desulfatibacillum alkenivorans DSM 16219 TaxID=1121393 RepID=A0A1M6T4C7_9BACT|nr:acetylornithine transaminase [Desulfatibacillum alkenivorans]SHK51801.1 acetylornithine aminotransferase apoenzyme [Desulfatibacillum alkenivorans DSM 16219]
MNNTKQLADQVIANTYARNPICLVKGQGVKLWDEDGKEYTDFLAGIAVCILGHAHPAVTQAVSEQAAKLVHVSNLFYTEPQTLLADQLISSCFADRVFFCNSGAEANEAAIKMARKYFSAKGQPEKYRVIAMEKSFHGRTFATMAATGQDAIKKGFEPMMEGFDHVPFNDLEAVEKAITDETCAVLTEPIQAEGGVMVPFPGYLPGLRELCDKKGILLIFDEVQTGMGRTGSLFAHQQMGAAPDIMTLAKGLANGLPIGAALATEEVASAFTPGSHATTFGGTPLVTAAARAVMIALMDQDLLELSISVGDYFKNQLLLLKEKFDCVEEVRGMGLLLGLKLNTPGAPIAAKAMDMGYIFNVTQGDVLRFVPPLIISRKDVDGLIETLDKILADSQ